VNIHILQHQFQTNFTIIRLILLKISAYWKKHNHRHAKKAMIWKCSNVKHNFIQHIKCFISTFKSSGGFHIKIIYSYWKKCHTNKNRSITCFTGKYVCTGNENSKPIWNKFIIRKDIIATSQVVLNFGRTVYKPGWVIQCHKYQWLE
jgi:hypothetical protein